MEPVTGEGGARRSCCAPFCVIALYRVRQDYGLCGHVQSTIRSGKQNGLMISRRNALRLRPFMDLRGCDLEPVHLAGDIVSESCARRPEVDQVFDCRVFLHRESYNGTFLHLSSWRKVQWRIILKCPIYSE